MTQHSVTFSLLQALFGPTRSLVIPNHLVLICERKVEVALFVSQLVYWCERTKRKDGFFYKAYKDWEEEIYLSKHRINKCAEWCERQGWLERRVKKANGSPTVHYRLDKDKFVEWMYERSKTLKVNEKEEDEEGGEGVFNQSGKLKSQLSIVNDHSLSIVKGVNYPITRDDNIDDTTCLSAKDEIFSTNSKVIPTTHHLSSSKKKENEGRGGGEDIPPNDPLSVDTVDKALQDPNDEAWEDPGRVFMSIPSSSSSKKNEGKMMEVNGWASRYKLLDSAPPHIRDISYVVFVHTGYEPEGVTKGNWFKQINDLWEASGRNEEILVEGLLSGQRARKVNNLNFSGPRGYTSFVREAKAKSNLRSRSDSHKFPKTPINSQNPDKVSRTKPMSAAEYDAMKVKEFEEQGMVEIFEEGPNPNNYRAFQKPDGTRLLYAAGRYKEITHDKYYRRIDKDGWWIDEEGHWIDRFGNRTERPHNGETG